MSNEDNRVISSGVDVTDDGEPTDERCKQCGGVVCRYPWWDDTPEAGGVCIGDLMICQQCGDEDTR